MCISAAPAHFSRTTVYGGEVTTFGKPVHVVGYQNTFRNNGRPAPTDHPDLGWHQAESKGNAMLLHFPAKSGTMTQENVLDTSGCPHLLEDMEEAIQIRERGGNRSLGFLCDSAPDVVVFDHGIYTIVLAQDGKYIYDVLEKVHAEKRPPMNREVFDLYSEWFPQWPVALCCFNNSEAKKADPMLWWFEPTRPDILFVPALDGHDGKRPRPGEFVTVDHTVLFGSDKFDRWVGNKVVYQDNPGEVLKKYLPQKVMGEQFPHVHLPNGDFIASVEAVRKGNPEYKRELPPNR